MRYNIGLTKYDSTQVYIQGVNRKQNGKQKRETIAVLTKWPKHLVTALEAGLKNKQVTDFKDFQFTQGKSFGGIYVMP